MEYGLQIEMDQMTVGPVYFVCPRFIENFEATCSQVAAAGIRRVAIAAKMGNVPAQTAPAVHHYGCQTYADGKISADDVRGAIHLGKWNYI